VTEKKVKCQNRGSRVIEVMREDRADASRQVEEVVKRLSSLTWEGGNKLLQ